MLVFGAIHKIHNAKIEPFNPHPILSLSSLNAILYGEKFNMKGEILFLPSPP